MTQQFCFLIYYLYLTVRQEVKFKKSIGPLLKEVKFNKEFFNKEVEFNKLTPIKNAIGKIKKSIGSNKDLIGFCGAPWSLSCYMVEGGGAKDFVKTRKLLWNNEKLFVNLINKLTKSCGEILEYQYQSGATVLMIFDTWSNMILTDIGNISELTQQKYC